MKSLAFLAVIFAGVSVEAATVNLADSAEQQFENNSAAVNIQTVGYGVIKGSTGTGTANLTRKEYFQFDLSAQNPDYTQAATFNFTTAASGNGGNNESLALYGLNQAYDNFGTPDTTYPGDATNYANAQANDTGNTGFLATAGNSATQIATLTTGSGAATGNAGASTLYSFTLPAGWNSFVFDNKITLAITGTTAVIGSTPLRILDQASAATVPSTPVTYLQFTPAAATPEPASLSLLGLCGLALLRRRK